MEPAASIAATGSPPEPSCGVTDLLVSCRQPIHLALGHSFLVDFCERTPDQSPAFVNALTNRNLCWPYRFRMALRLGLGQMPGLGNLFGFVRAGLNSGPLSVRLNQWSLAVEPIHHVTRMITSPRNTRLIIFDGICTTAMNALFVGPFLAAFALALGATHWEIGLISAIAFLSMPMQLLGLYAVDRWKQRRALIIWCALTGRLLWILIVFLPFARENSSVRSLLTILVLIGFITAIPGPAWHSLVRSLIPVDSLGEVFSKRMAWGTVVGLCLTLAGGFFVDAWATHSGRPPLEAYSVLFSIGILFGVAGVVAITRLPEPPMGADHSESFRSLVWLPLRDAGFRSLLWFIVLWNFAINLATPFFVVFMLERLMLPMRVVTGLIVLQQLVMVLSVRIWGTLSDRFSNKAVLSTS